MSTNRIVGAIEIGTSKVVVLVGELQAGRALQILGMGQRPSAGVRKGDIVDLRAATSSVHSAILEAEKSASTRIDGVYLAVTGSHLEGFPNHGDTVVSASDNYVTAADVRKACDSAKSKSLPPGRIYIHHIRSGYVLDGRAVDDPSVMCGDRLEVHYWHVHGDERKVTNGLHIINSIGLTVDDIILSSIASGSMLVSEEEKRHGVLVVDFGGGVTDFALYKNGSVVRTGVIPVGGEHLTNDLSLGLRINAKHAESIKLKYGKAIVDKDDKNDSVLLLGDLTIGDRSIPRLAIYKILQARVEETLMILKNKLGSAIGPQQIPAGVILTGGGSRLRLLPEAARAVLGVEARLGEISNQVAHPELRQPEYATALGLLHYSVSASAPEARQPGGLLRRVRNLFALK